MARAPVLAISVVCLEHLQYKLSLEIFFPMPMHVPFKGMDHVRVYSGLVILENSVTDPRTCDSVQESC